MSSNFGKMRMAKCAKLQFAQFIPPYLKENATYIENIFHSKNCGEIVFQKQAAYLSFAQKKFSIKVLMKLTPGACTIKLFTAVIVAVS